MGIVVGDRLGRFQILGALGSGGMGDVYRARDDQLRREVAIKTLPPERWGDPVRQRRLEQEARAAAALSHPNVLAVYDFGVHDGVAFIVTELLHGETLRHRLGERLPAQKAVEYAIQIASGLAAGHDRGTIHRDIKPENLFVTRDGLVKVLDFGLASPGATVPPGPETSRTLTADGLPLDGIGGTATYMSPEQARGLRADHRSDIFSLGSVLFEMLAGSAPFRRDTIADTLSAVLNDEVPDPTGIPAVDPALVRVVRHCLEKRPEDRFQHARDLIFALQGLANPASTSGASDAVPRRTTRRARVLVALALASAAATGYLVGRRAPGEPPAGATYTMQRLTELQGLEEFPAISPDRRSVAFTASVDGRRQIFIRLLAGGAPLAITKDPVDHQQPRWSPDGNSIVYFASGGEADQGAIWAIPALGGSPRRLLASISGADVGRNGRVACFQIAGGRIRLVTADLDGSDLRVVLPSSAGYHRYPRWSPDGRWIAFQLGDGVRDDVFLVPAEGGEPRRLTRDRTHVSGLAWRPSSDRLVYASSRGNTLPYLPRLRLWEIALDGGPPRPLTAAEASYEQPDVHGTGLASAGSVRMRFDIWRFPFGAAGREGDRGAEQVTRQTGQVLTPTPSPDGERIAFLADSGGHANLWVLSHRNGELRQITFERDPAVAVGVPIWSPDGRSIAFVSSRGRTGLEFGLWLVDPDGGALRKVADRGLGPAWSPDGKWLYYCETSDGSLKKVPASGGTPVLVRSGARNAIGLHDGTLYYTVERPLVDGRPEFEIHAASPEDGPSRLVARIPVSRVPPWQIVNPALSPDGQWLAMPLTDGFATNIWVLSTATHEWRRVTDFGDRAIFIARRVAWSPDGTSLLAAVGDGDADIVLLDGLR